MKSRLFLLSLFISTLCAAQTTVSIRLNSSTGQDMSLGNNISYLAPDSLSTEIGAVQWTCGGSPCELTALFRFDLSSIPSNAIVTDARLSLFAHPQQLNGNPVLGPMYGTANACTLFPLLSSWSYSQTTWTQFPSYTSINSVSLPQSTTNPQDYLQIDVTSSVMQMVSNPSQNYGWMLKMDGTNYYNSMIFCSGDYGDSTRHPLLEITYEIPSCTEFRLHTTTGIDISYGNNPSYLSPDSLSTDLGAVQWTCGGNPCELRALMQFDLSAIPQGTTILNARLSLYANPAQQNGNPALGPMYGTANSCELLKITSPWTLNNVNWANQPTYTTNNLITLSQSTSAYQNYQQIDVTSIVQDWVNQPSLNYGWMIKMTTGSFYNSMLFSSSDFPDSTKHPKLEICYETVGLSEIKDQIPFEVYPNPATTRLTIHVSKQSSVIQRIAITDIAGKSIEMNSALPQSGQPLSIDISSLAKGMYFLRLDSQDGLTGTKRFIKN